jgi:hypothetical protein
VPAAQTTLTSLSIPAAGNYVVWAKGFATGGAANTNVTCQLVAGTDTDQTQTYSQAGQGFSFALLVVHNFTAAGTADLQCATAGTSVTANQLRIAAIKVNTLTSTS